MSGFSSDFGEGFDSQAGSYDGEFSCQFGEEFSPGCEPLVTIGQIGLRMAERPKPPSHSRLWRRYAYPLTAAAVLLWETGEVKVVSQFDDESLTADDIILGGHVWYAPRSSWQAQALEAAGFTLIDYEGSVA